MPDDSHLDRKYFIDNYVYNCPFCNRRHVRYTLWGRFFFHWTNEKQCFGYIVRCGSCGQQSMHLSFESLELIDLQQPSHHRFNEERDLDPLFFYSVPTSFFIMDRRIPRILRELVTEADGSLKMNFLTGASACARKAIYELLVQENAEGADYESRIKSLKAGYPGVDPNLFDILAHIQDMTSDKVHEQSWDKWDSPQLRLILETLKAVFHEIYVVPKEREERSRAVIQMREQLMKDKKRPAAPSAARPTNGKAG